jgi:hypothetical protein
MYYLPVYLFVNQIYVIKHILLILSALNIN